MPTGQPPPRGTPELPIIRKSGVQFAAVQAHSDGSGGHIYPQLLVYGAVTNESTRPVRFHFGCWRQLETAEKAITQFGYRRQETCFHVDRV